MKKILIICMLLSTSLINGQAQNNNDSLIVASRVVIKSLFTPFLFETFVRGKTTFKNDSISFSASPCHPNQAHTVAPCNNHLIKKINLRYNDIEYIKKRNYLFIVPDRVYIRMKNNDRYIFTVSHRRKVLKFVREHCKRVLGG